MAAIPRVGVVGVPGEAHTVFVLERLPAHGAQPVFVNASVSRRLSLADDEATYDGHRLNQVGAFYLRSLYGGASERPEASGDWGTDQAAARERHGLWVSWLRGAVRRGQLVVNSVDANDLHSLKPYTLQLLREAGVPVPASLVTSDADALRGFCRRHGQVIGKPVAGGALARLVDEEDFSTERLAVLRLAPVLFQEYVPGRNLRIYTLDGQTIAAGVIQSDAVDYRAAEGPVERVIVPAAVEALALAAAAATGCIFSSVDLKWTPDGRAVVLDCNPSPMFLGFDRKAGTAVGETLVAFLVRRAARST